jgi:NAD(P)H-hydrate epimerase
MILMVPVVTAQQMKTIDRLAIENWGIEGLVLMENAGRGVVAALSRELPDLSSHRVLIVCGKGNNGGDGFVAARHLHNLGVRTSCALLGTARELKGDALVNARMLLNAGLPVAEISEIDQLARLIAESTVIIDAIFGTGLTAAPTGIYARAIELINQHPAYTVSVDIPSGVNADTGELLEPAVRADLTVTMALPKIGLLLYPGKKCTGKLAVADIGIPKNLLHQHTTTFLIDEHSVRQIIPPRVPDGNKGTFGTCLLICGSRGYTGAACLTAMAAVRAGAGLVRLAYPQSLSPVIESRILEPVKHPLPETPEISLSPEALPRLLELNAAADAIALGPGIGTHPQTRALLTALLPQLEKPVVIDADGINNLAGQLEILKQTRVPVILTPHPGELSRLTGISPLEINRQRVNIAREFARQHQLILVLKGAPTVIASPDQRVFINPTGNSGLATGGTGDVLTGLIAGLLAQGAKPIDAAIAGVFLHGKAGDLAAQELTEYCLAAGDLLQYLPRAFARLLAPPAPDA